MHFLDRESLTLNERDDEQSDGAVLDVEKSPEREANASTTTKSMRKRKAGESVLIDGGAQEEV